MKSLFTNTFIVLIILTIISNISQLVLSAASSVNLVSLYNANDQLTILTSENFSSTVYKSNTAWLVEFYASWCGHCQSYANTYREIAVETWIWKTVVRVGALNCYGGNNEAFCHQHRIRGYPTLRFIPPGAIFDNTSKVIDIPAADANAVQKGVIKELERIHKKYKQWPYFMPINRITLEEIYSRVPPTNKVIFVIVEKRDDIIGRQIMLDYSKYREKIAIFRTTTDGKLWIKFNISIIELPALFAIRRNRTAERIKIEKNDSYNNDTRNLFTHTIRSYIQKTNYIDDFDDRDLEEVALRKNALKNTEKRLKLVQKSTLTDDVRDEATVHHKVNMVDLELALSYMFRKEIPQMKQIQGDAYYALVQWLNVLTEYFPGRQPIMTYFQHLLSKVNQEKNGFSGSQFQEMMDMKQSNAYLPNDHVEYQHCAGSAPQYRGYPCALWLLFHTLTVSQYQKDSQHINVTEIPFAIKNYIKHFFGCRQCSDNFMKETINMTQLDSQNRQEAIIYLWKVHNNVNRRLQGQITEDPKHPKVQFPSRYLCATCKAKNNSQNTNEYNLSKTVDFLLDYYTGKNIDISLLSNESNHVKILSARQERLTPITDRMDVKSQFVFQNKTEQSQQIEYRSEKLQHIEYRNEKQPRTKYKDEKMKYIGFAQSFMTIAQHFSLYIFISFIIILVLFRRRFCKVKTKRYIV